METGIKSHGSERQHLRAATNRRLRRWINKERISYALEKARNNAIKAKCSGFTPLDLSGQMPKKSYDGTPIKLVQWKDSPVDMHASMYQLALAEIEATTEKVLIPYSGPRNPDNNLRCALS